MQSFSVTEIQATHSEALNLAAVEPVLLTAESHSVASNLNFSRGRQPALLVLLPADLPDDFCWHFALFELPLH
jgi:hypothetical protein